VLLGLLTAYLLSRRQFIGRRAFEFATMLSFAIPGTVVGVSHILAFNVPPIELLRPANPRHLFCVPQHAGWCALAFAAMSKIDRSLVEASLVLRARSDDLRRIIVRSPAALLISPVRPIRWKNSILRCMSWLDVRD
jgi:iron(III) transport system permease protein